MLVKYAYVGNRRKNNCHILIIFNPLSEVPVDPDLVGNSLGLQNVGPVDNPEQIGIN